MDKLGEFVDGLQTILDAPNPPQGELVRVIQLTQREFLSSALAVATVTWPTRTHLELVKIVIGMSIPEPAPELVMTDPTTNHESPPFFASDYFDKLQQQLLSMSAQQLADSDGSWVRNVGFSIEATLMQATRRMDALEKLEELATTNPELSRVRIYCSHVLGSGTLAAPVWEAIARTAFVVFYILPSSERAVGGDLANLAPGLPDKDGSRDLHMAKLIAHYSSWLTIVSQMVENHGPTLCRRLPTVVEDPATRQFKWGIPTLHAVATTEILRNLVMRQTLLPGRQRPDETGAPTAEELELEQLEKSILGSVISKDASAVYGMMSELHRLLQMLAGCTKGRPQSSPAPGTPECLAVSLTRTCHGLAPILGFDEQALTQAMDMNKLCECLADMKRTALQLYYVPLYGRYPRAAGASPAYAECLLLRMATTLFNIDQPWGDAMDALSPAAIPAIALDAADRLTKVLRVTAVFFDAFSLCTAEPGGSRALEQAGLDTVTARLLRQPFMRQSRTGDLAVPEPVPSLAESMALAIGWTCDFIVFGRRHMAPQILRPHCEAALDHTVAHYACRAGAEGVADILKHIPFSAWRLLASTRFGSRPDAPSDTLDSAMGVMWSCAQRLLGSKSLGAGVLDVDRWQAAVALCCPEGAFLAFAVMALCAELARQLVRPDPNGAYSALLSKQGASALRALEQALTADGLQAWPVNGLLFVPPIYARTDGEKGALLAQAQLPRALRILATCSPAEWALQLGLDAPSGLPFAESDMRKVACLVSDYAHGAPDMFTLLPRLLATPGALSTPHSGGSGSAENPFASPNILSRLPPIETPLSPNACNIDNAVRQWLRNTACLSFAESGRHIQALISSCYVSNSKHYLEAVVVRFMEADPVVGVELTIGSIADHMWKSQIVYSRRASPFYAIREMFVDINPPKDDDDDDDVDGATVPDGVRLKNMAARLARSHKEPVFNAVVGGKVRPRGQAKGGSGSLVLTTAEQESETAAAVATPTALVSVHGAPGGPGCDDDGDEPEGMVRCPAACLRILLLLTDLCYGNSMRDTPIHMWLTDCLDSAPVSLLVEYFDHVVGKPAPNFSPSLPLEPDWPKKAKATVSMWVNDRRLGDRPLLRAACVAIMRHVLGDGAQGWQDRWIEWKPVIKDTLYTYFTKPTPSPIQIEIVRSIIAVPLTAGGAVGPPTDMAAAIKTHPLRLLTDMLCPASERSRLVFADSRDWFLVHFLPQLMDTLASSESSREILGAMLSSHDALYQTVPWLDIATSLVQNVPLRNGCPVTMTPKKAKEHFISYLSPLARLLFAIAAHINGDAGAAKPAGQGAPPTAAGDDASMAKMDIDSAEPAECLADTTSDSGHDEDGFNWQWLDERLVLYVSSSSGSGSDVLSDTLDALVDVYTYSSMRGLRRSIENVIAACCLHDPAMVQPVLNTLFGQRPLDVFTLHTLRPKELSTLAPLSSAASDGDALFRPAAEVYPLARRVLLLGLGDGGAHAAAAVAKAIENCMWAVSEEPDVRRNLIALKPRLIPKEQRPAATETSTSEDTVLQTTSGSLHIPAESVASAAAYALDRSVYLIGLLAVRANENPCLKRAAVALAHSRAFLAVLMIAVGDSMRQFTALSATRELLSALWTLTDAGSDEIDGVTVRQAWAGVNFCALAQRLNSQLPEEYTTWAHIQALPAKY
ncbi:hypothetical protein LPJ61_002931 [Coemansia biformis]|uniref:Uncharacterized protein n=1 Tax=Coemansia biformis TaxID=1286918 RepID=A0A9W7YD28_9FUNG|nr:hypothetical protein LPJ61_002931 [Coemansia biformis]